MRLSVGLYRFEFRTIAVVITLVVIAVCTRLGFWQLSRAQDKTERLAQIAQYSQADALSLDGLLKMNQDPTGVNLNLQGEFLPKLAWLLDNRTVNGQPGYDVLLAFRPELRQQAIIINMGWLKGDYAKREVLPTFDIPKGPITIKGFVKGGKQTQFVLSDKSEGNNWPKRVPQVNLEQFAQQAGIPLYDFVVYAQPMDLGFVHHYQPVVMGPEKHKAYALQWFLLALAALVIFLLAAKEQKTKNQENNNDRP